MIYLTALQEVISSLYATITSVIATESSFTSWWETAVWTVPQGHWCVLGGGNEILENRVL